MKLLLLFYFLIVGFLSFAGNNEDDYVITRQRDTLYGIIGGNLLNRVHMTLSDSGEKKVFEYNDILEYKIGKSIYQVVGFTNKNGKVSYDPMEVLVNGKLRILYHCSRCDTYYFLVNKSLFMITKSNLKNKVLPYLNECEGFQLFYKNHTEKLLLSAARNYRALKLMAEVYNSKCK
jgi:hypothetical protein